MPENRFKKTNPMGFASDLFRKKDTTEERTGIAVPEGMFIKCKKCKTSVYAADLKDNLFVCPKCGYYHRVTAMDRIDMVVDADTFAEWDHDMPVVNPLNYPDYEEKVKNFQTELGIKEAVISGCGKIYGEQTAIAVMDARFMMASMGSVVGEKITRAIERSTELELPMIIFTCSGGARMQEGMISLMQMAKTSAALERHHDAGLPYFVVLTDPTTGGVTASFAMLGDVIMAEPEALIGFAGQRVIEQTIGQKLPKDFQRAEFALQHGLIDAIVERVNLKQTLADLIIMHRPYQMSERSGE